MIDLVEQANPADLESAGEALKKARDAIATAAGELGDHIDRVDWEGEAGRAFRKWGKKLVKETHQLSDFADIASAQIASAGAGLASVRSSMPPRDTRADPKAVEDIPSPKRTDGNEEYQAAVKAEKHRQEAINQMNRLASFYRVSHHEMAAQEPPTFSAMPNVGVPRPSQRDGNAPVSAAQQAAPTGASPAGDPPMPERPSDTVGPSQPGASDSSLPRNEVHGPIALSDLPPGAKSVGTEIDSAGPLPLPTANPVPVSQPPAPSPTGIDGGPLPIPGGGPAKLPLGGPPTRAPYRGANEGPPVPGMGRAGTGDPKESIGRSGRNPSGGVERSVPVPPGKGTSGPTAPVQSPVGRGITGGTPQPRHVPSLRPGVPGITGTPRADGVVGGRPSPGPAAGSPASRMPRSPITSAEGSGYARAGTGGAGQRGVMGAAPRDAIGDGQTLRRPGSNPDGVVGTPKERGAAAGSRNSGFTAGGTGLVRGTAGRHRRSEQEDDRATQRPDYLVEDEETHVPGQRPHVPPVIGQS